MSFPMISSVFLFLENYFKFLDNVWLFQFHDIPYGENVKSLLEYIRKANEAKFFPTFIEKSKEPLFPPPQDSRRDQFTFPMYKNIIGKNAYFLANAENMYLWGALSTIGTLVLFLLIGKVFHKTVLIIFFGRYQSFAFCFAQFMEPRISNTSFLFFTEVQAACSIDLKEKISFIFCSLYFFVIIFYSLTAYVMYRYFYRTRDKTPVLCKIFKNLPRTFFYFTSSNIQLVLEAFIHSFLHNYGKTQLVLLMIVTMIGFVVIVKCHQIFESVIQFFIYVFYSVSRLLFLFFLWISL